MADETLRFPDWESFQAYELANPRGDDPLNELMTYCSGEPDRWLAVGRQLHARQSAGMERGQALASIKADLEANRL